MLSCVSVNRRTSRRLMHSTLASTKVIAGAMGVEKRQKADEDKMVEELVEHLKRIAPFNKRWQVIETINQGTYGVVFSVQDVVTKVFGVIKVAKSLANDSGNASAEWEGFILETMFKRSEIASVVRLLDKGMLADQHEEGMEFVVLEKAGVPVKDYIFEVLGRNCTHHILVTSSRTLVRQFAKMRSSRPELSQCKARMDYSPPILTAYRELWKTALNRNEKDGVMRWIVSDDLKLVELKGELKAFASCRKQKDDSKDDSMTEVQK